jgi:2-polyprenyl-3-methyl-5-hydroxy-6-metoxy-1,4-benzoquinol methylase
MRFVIEHLLDFKAYTNRVMELLKPGGIFFFSTPDIDSAQAMQLKENWNLINDFGQKTGHLRWFNRHSIRYFAKQLDAKIEKITNRGQFLFHLPLPVQNFLRKSLGTEPDTNRFIKYYTLRIVYATMFDGLLSQLLGWGDGLYVFMRKQ